MILAGFRLDFGLDFALSLAFNKICLTIIASHKLSELSRKLGPAALIMEFLPFVTLFPE